MNIAPGRLLADGRERAPASDRQAPWLRMRVRGRARGSGMQVIGEGLRTILARWPISLSVTLVALAGTFVFARFITPQYQSSALILIQVRTPELFGGATVNEQFSRDYISTQLDVIRSQQVALRVVDNLGPQRGAELLQMINWRVPLSADTKLKLAVWMLQRIHAVQGGGRSRALVIIFRAPFRHLNDVIVNGFVQAYSEVVAERQAAPAEAAERTVERILAREREHLLNARATLSAGQRDQQILLDNDLPSPEQQRLRSLAFETARMDYARAAVGGSLTARATLGAQSDRVTRELQVALADIEGRRAQLAASAGPGSADARQLAAQADALRAQIVARLSVMQSAAVVTSAQVGAAGQVLGSALGTSHDQLVSANSRAGALRSLMSEASNAGTNYRGLLGSQMQTQLLGRSQLSNVAVLRAAEEPRRPVWPRKFLMLAAALVFGSMVGCTLVLFIELFDRRLRTSEDLERRLGIVNLGEVRAFHGAASRGALPGPRAWARARLARRD